MATRRAILHLGTYKTGSSSIQNLCHANRGRLLKRGLLYPKSGLLRNETVGHRHRRVVSSFIEGATASYVMEPLRREIARRPRKSVLLSSEAWSHPRNLPMLCGFKAELEDLGFSEVWGVIFFRRLADYEVSHFREFTLRQGNTIGFDKYLRSVPGMFDYLFLARYMRATFGKGLRAIDYAASGDAVEAFFAATEMSELLPEMQSVVPANVRPIRALGTEAMRQANLKKLSREAGLAFVSEFQERHPDLFEAEWTERETSPRPIYGASYRQALKRALHWSPEAVERLLEPHPNEGRPVSEVRPVIKQALKDWIARQESAA